METKAVNNSKMECHSDKINISYLAQLIINTMKYKFYQDIFIKVQFPLHIFKTMKHNR